MADEDAFWTVALLTPRERDTHVFDDEDVEVADKPSDDDVSCTERYRIPNSTQTLVVRPSISLDGELWSPLGAHTWYGAALLTACLTSSGVDSPFTRLLNGQKDLTALELGSGAVGLAGLSLASRLSQSGARKSHIFLSDNVASLVVQLQQNVRANKKIYSPQVECSVLCLDWNEAATWDLPPLDLIFGSELVYTPATAKACLQAILHWTANCPEALVCILQVTDREGWAEVLVPGLQEAGLYVRQEPVDDDSDAVAQQLLKRGGALDRFAFGILFASRTEAVIVGDDSRNR